MKLSPYSPIREDSAHLLIDYINDMLDASYLHGGDDGGPYGSDEKPLRETMKRFLRWAGLNALGYVVTRKVNGCLQFALLAEPGGEEGET